MKVHIHYLVSCCLFVLFAIVFSIHTNNTRVFAQEFAHEEIVNNLYVPWSIVFYTDTNAYLSQRNGTIVNITKEADTWIKRDYYVLNDVSQSSEAGLMGLALDPDYTTNKYVYAMYAYENQNELKGKVIRLTDVENTFDSEQIIIDDLPCAQFHCGGRIEFGPDGKLYIAVGDARTPLDAQDASSLAGKVLRINSDGSVPDDNPIDNSYIFTSGHRNIQGLTWHPESELLFASEHGPSGVDGVGGGDEINVLAAGNNYGWPIVSHSENRDDFVAPAYLFAPDGPPAEAPASAHIVTNSNHPWYGNLLVGALYGGDIIKCEVQEQEIQDCRKLGLRLGRIRDITQSPDGTIYFTTSNTDGRSTVRGTELSPDDDKIYRLNIDMVTQDRATDGPELLPIEQASEQSLLSRIMNVLLYPFSVIAGWLRTL